MRLSELRRSGKLLMHLPPEATPNGGEFVLADNSSAVPGGQSEFVVWRIDVVDRDSCFSGSYFPGRDRLELFVQAVNCLCERAGKPVSIREIVK